MTTDDLVSRINGLSYDNLVEAANFYFPQAVGMADLQAVEESLAKTVLEHDGEYSELGERLAEIRRDESSIEYLLRTVLVHEASNNEDAHDRLIEALDGVGKNQVIVEVIYAIFAATSLGLVWLIRPPTEKISKTKRKMRPDGSFIETAELTVKEIPLPIDKLFGWIGTLRSVGGGKEQRKK